MYRRKYGCRDFDNDDGDRYGSTESHFQGVDDRAGSGPQKLGAEVVYPEKDMAYLLGKKLVSNSFMDFLSLDDSVEIRQVQVSGSANGRSIEELALRRNYQLNIIAIERNHKTTIEIHPEDRLWEGDIISVIGKVDAIDKFEDQL